MTDDSQKDDGVRVPEGRVGRLARAGGLATGIAGGALAEATRRISRGDRVTFGDVLLTPGNITRLADELARMRGAAMKVGQLLSMDAGDILPPELADVLSRLRENAKPMPGNQLRKVLDEAWGRGWLKHFSKFEVAPIAAASIGQVHRARTKDGRDLAVKVQYPGVANSIDSDIDNVSTLIKLSGILPEGADISHLLAEGKRQLHEEADYVREGHYLQKFRQLLADDNVFVVPGLHEDLTTSTVLAMDYLPGQPVEALIDVPEEERSATMTRLIGLVMRELFDFRLMQTDPNFANYRVQRDSGKIVLLDFGATRGYDAEMTENYRVFLRAGIDGDRDALEAASLKIGLFGENTERHHRDLMLEMIELAVEPIISDGVFDFERSDLVPKLRDRGIKLRSDRTYTHIPPINSLFVQRKIAGIYLLAARLRAKVNFRPLIEPYL